MAQLALFPDQDAGPAGLRYQPEFVPQTAESELIARISELPLQPFQFGAFEGKRRVASFGFHYDYALRKLQEADPIPGWLASIIPSVENFGELPEGSVRRRDWERHGRRHFAFEDRHLRRRGERMAAL